MDFMSLLKVSRTCAADTMVAGRFVIPSGNVDEVASVSAANTDAYGVLESAPRDAGDGRAIFLAGAIPVESGGAISDGDNVITDNVGRAITDPKTGSTTSFIQGKAMGAVSGSGQAVTILLQKFTIKY